MTISPDTLCFLAVAVLFVLFVLPRLMSMMSGGASGYPQGNYPQNNTPGGGGNRPTYDSPDVESQGGIGRDRPRNGGGIFGNVLSRPSGPSSSSGGGIFNAPPSSHSNSGGSFGSSSSRHDSPDVESQGGIGRDRN